MQLEVTLSTIKAEYIALSQSTRNLIIIKEMIDLLNTFIKIDLKVINIFLTVFRDNSSALKLALGSKYIYCTKHICIKYYY